MHNNALTVALYQALLTNGLNYLVITTTKPYIYYDQVAFDNCLITNTQPARLIIITHLEKHATTLYLTNQLNDHHQLQSWQLFQPQGSQLKRCHELQILNPKLNTTELQPIINQYYQAKDDANHDA